MSPAHRDRLEDLDPWVEEERQAWRDHLVDQDPPDLQASLDPRQVDFSSLDNAHRQAKHLPPPVVSEVQ